MRRGFAIAVLAVAAGLTARPAAADTASRVNDALAKYQNGDTKGALADLSEAIAASGRKDLSTAVAYYDRGVIYDDLGQRQKALADFSAAIALRPTYGEAHSARAAARLASGDAQGAIADLKALLGIDPAFPDAHYHLARAYQAAGMTAEAQSEYATALKTNPKAYVYEGRGILNMNSGHTEAAIADFSAALKAKPDRVSSQVDRGQAYLAAHDYEAALADFESALKSAPGNAAATVGRATALTKLGRTDAAQSAVQAAVAADPKSAARLYRTRGDAELSHRAYKAAIADYDRALAAAPNNVVALINRGAAHHGLGQFPAAAADYKAALRLRPNDPMIYNNLGNALAAQGKLDKAIAEYDKALKIDPAYGPAKRNRAGAVKARVTGRKIRGD